MYNYLAPLGMQSIVISQSVCLSACLSGRILVTRKPRSLTSPNVWCLLPVDGAQSSDGVEIRYVLPVLRMTVVVFSYHVTLLSHYAKSKQMDVVGPRSVADCPCISGP